jgi:hypothetical protein
VHFNDINKRVVVEMKRPKQGELNFMAVTGAVLRIEVSVIKTK